MGTNESGLNHDLAAQTWSKSFAVQVELRQYFRKFMGTGLDSMILTKKDLNKQAHDQIDVILKMKLGGKGIGGGGQIEEMPYFHNNLFIDQRLKGIKIKDIISGQTVPHNMRLQGRNDLATWWAEDYDQMIMMYLAGARGVDTSSHVDTSFTGWANNRLLTPDSAHIIYGGKASCPNDICVSDKMSLGLIERLIAKAETTDPIIHPFMVEGEKKFVLLMHTFQAYELRASISPQDWVGLVKVEGSMADKNKLYRNALGEYGDIIMHKNRNVIRFNDYGTGSTLSAARALFLGAQAGMIAWGGGSPHGRYNWNEETDDQGDGLIITADSIYGVKKSIYTGPDGKRADFGVIAVDTAVDDPNS